jgi:hypothetical protein
MGEFERFIASEHNLSLGGMNSTDERLCRALLGQQVRPLKLQRLEGMTVAELERESALVLEAMQREPSRHRLRSSCG